MLQEGFQNTENQDQMRFEEVLLPHQDISTTQQSTSLRQSTTQVNCEMNKPTNTQTLRTPAYRLPITNLLHRTCFQALQLLTFL
jgi:hypothetical protein